eukprot:TRINITY_DN768_c0_g1_i1.p1 TRINITY_DN768_c0_g1~~TRINITY_DN768_c0_g1_i1.p1  ORF type:complete len:644 (+),score=153.08 TRINITY_DN768_c0_g1_i1:37-1932(+)
MAVLVTTSLGEMVIDLYADQCPVTCKNFLKLCKIKYYNNCLFHSVQKDFLSQTGDPTGTGSGGESIYSLLYGEQARFFDDEIKPKVKHEKIGVVAMASAGENQNASQFYITTRTGIDYLDGKHTIFGEVAEGLETLMRINEAYVDEKGRPYKNIRIKYTDVLEDPFDDPPGLAELIPDKSPDLRPPAPGEDVRLEDDWVPMDEQQDAAELEQSLRKKEAHSRAVVLEMIGDIPEAEVKPPENVLFVCKLNPVTQDEDLEIIFARFGKVVSADIIRDYKTGDSLCYGFIEFDTQEACEAAYFKMDNTLIDDRRIHVDFSQSVSRLWTRFRRFGTKEAGGEGAYQGNNACFKCGEAGHFAKDCVKDAKDAENEVPLEAKRYELKEDRGQRGEVGKKYDMVFEDQDNDGRKGSPKPEVEKPKMESAHRDQRRSYRDRHSDRRHGHGDDDATNNSRTERREERQHDKVSRERGGDEHRREEGRDTYRYDERFNNRDNYVESSSRHERHQRHRDDYHRTRGSEGGRDSRDREAYHNGAPARRDREREVYNGDTKRRDSGEDGAHRERRRDDRDRKSERERERMEEARRDQEDREKEAAERASRDRKRKEKDGADHEEEKQPRDRPRSSKEQQRRDS